MLAHVTISSGSVPHMGINLGEKKPAVRGFEDLDFKTFPECALSAEGEQRSKYSPHLP